jgi:hypothetical protein
MSHSRKKNNKRIAAAQIQKTQNAELEKQLDELNQQYRKLYALFHELLRANTFSKREKTLCYRGDPLDVLMFELKNLREHMTDMIEDKKIRDNEALLLFIKVEILVGRLYFCFDNAELGFTAYIRAITVLTHEDQHLKYQNDLFFIEQVRSIFFVLHAKSVKLTEDGPMFMRVAVKLFESKCNLGNTFVKFSKAHKNLEDLFINGHNQGIPQKKLIAQTKNCREDFFRSAEQMKSSLEKIKMDGLFSGEYQLMYIILNYCIMNISELSNPRSLLIIKSVNGVISNWINPIKYHETKYYVDVWLSLKKDYVTYSLALIENMNAEELNFDKGLHKGYTKHLGFWNAYFLRKINLFLMMTDAWLLEMGSLKGITDQFQQEVQEYIFNIEAEKTILISYVSIIANAAAKIKCDLQEDVNARMILDRAAEMDLKISELKSSVKKLEQEKLRIARETAAELIREETQKKDELARKRHLHYLHSLSQLSVEEDQHEFHASDDEVEIEFAPVTCISPELEQLLSVDEIAFNAADQLLKKSKAMVKFVDSRSHLTIPLTSKHHKTTYFEINNILLEYHELISLLDTHKILSQCSSILCQEKLSSGIDFSQDELKQRCQAIYHCIQMVLTLIDVTIDEQKKSKNDFIYKLGKKYAADHDSDEEIMRIGAEKFREMGKKNRAEQREVSEHTKLIQFLHVMKLTFSGFEYLQDKIYPHIFTSAYFYLGYSESRFF